MVGVFAALGKPSVSRGSAAVDLDNRRRRRHVIDNLDSAPTVLRNDDGNRRNFLVVQLEGPPSITVPSAPSSPWAPAISCSVRKDGQTA